MYSRNSEPFKLERDCVAVLVPQGDQVTLPAGSIIPVKIEISGDVFRADNPTIFPLVLNEPIHLMMSNGHPTGDWRFPGGNWELAQETLWVNIPWIKAELTTQNGTEIRTSLIVETRRQTSR